MAPDAAQALLAEVEAGIALLDRERRLCRAGRLDALTAIAAEKEAFAARLSAGMAGVGASADPSALGALRRGVERLARRARRNERLLRAAEEAVTRLRRARRARAALRRGRVGYGPDGGSVVSRADAAGPTRTA